jgi:hypothetical protein
MKIALWVAAAAAVFAAGCSEAPRDVAKQYAGKEDQKPWAGDQFKGDKAKWQQALDARNQMQNEERGRNN